MSEKSLVMQAAESAETLEDAQMRIARALVLLIEYGNIDGDHHKRWTIVEAMRELAGVHFDALKAARIEEGYDFSDGVAP